MQYTVLECLKKWRYEVLPKYDDVRSDIIQIVRLKNAEEVIAFCQGAQAAAPVDSYVKRFLGQCLDMTVKL